MHFTARNFIYHTMFCNKIININENISSINFTENVKNVSNVYDNVLRMTNSVIVKNYPVWKFFIL